MLVALLKKGICGDGCGNLGKAAEVLGIGEPYLAECRYGEHLAFCHPGTSYDYLVLRLDTSKLVGGHGSESYMPTAVSRELVLRKLREMRDLVCAIWEKLRPLVVILTTNPYLHAYTLGPGMRPWDVIEVAWHAEGAEYAKRINIRDLADLEAPPIMSNQGEKPPTLCTDTH